MAARKKTTDKSNQRQRALDMYVRGSAPPIGQAGAAPAEAGEMGGGLEAFGPGLGDDSPVSSEDQPQLAEATTTNPGSRGGDEVDPAAIIEPNLTSGRESAAPPGPVEETYLLDAWHAVYSDPGQRAMAIKQQNDARQSVLEVVIGNDDRLRVTNVTAFPWRAICSLLITARDDSKWIGTGWLIGRRTLITAGHCVYIKDRGGWVKEMQVIPGRNAGDEPFKRAKATSFRSVSGWTENTSRSHDYGAIILPEDKPYGEELGFFGIANLNDTQFNQLMVNLSGYPGDKPAGTHWFHARRITNCGPTFFSYDIDTAGGQSGAPVWRLQNGVRHAVGIHTNGSPTGNSATRINKVVFDNLMLWKGEGD
jgi:V8-like Glu-specific endopeptidase